MAWNGEIINDEFYRRNFVKKAVEELCLPLGTVDTVPY